MARGRMAEALGPIADLFDGGGTALARLGRAARPAPRPTKVPARFVLCVGFDPGPTKGVYVHHDATGSGKSLVALPGDAEPQPFPKGDWLIRAVLDPPRPGG